MTVESGPYHGLQQALLALQHPKPRVRRGGLSSCCRFSQHCVGNQPISPHTRPPPPSPIQAHVLPDIIFLPLDTPAYALNERVPLKPRLVVTAAAVAAARRAAAAGALATPAKGPSPTSLVTPGRRPGSAGRPREGSAEWPAGDRRAPATARRSGGEAADPGAWQQLLEQVAQQASDQAAWRLPAVHASLPGPQPAPALEQQEQQQEQQTSALAPALDPQQQPGALPAALLLPPAAIHQQGKPRSGAAAYGVSSPLATVAMAAAAAAAMATAAGTPLVPSIVQSAPADAETPTSAAPAAANHLFAAAVPGLLDRLEQGPAPLAEGPAAAPGLLERPEEGPALQQTSHLAAVAAAAAATATPAPLGLRPESDLLPPPSDPRSHA